LVSSAVLIAVKAQSQVSVVEVIAPPEPGESLITPVMAEPSIAELLRVFTDPKFHLRSEQIESLVADLLPWSETWSQQLPVVQIRCPVSKDQIVPDLAIGAGVQALISGDRDLLDLADMIGVPKIPEPEVFRHWLEQPGSTGAAQSGQDQSMS